MKLRLRIQRSLCIVQLLLTPTAVVSDVPRAPFVPTTTVMTTTNTDHNPDDRSTVLRELKETIRQQATEINSLHKQLKSIGIIPSDATKTKHLAVVPTNLHGGGGAASAAADDMTQYLHRPFYYIASQRVGWLGLFMISLSFTAIIMSEFEHILSQEVELAFFVPFLAGHGGNTGGQAVGTVLSALSAGVVTIKDAPKVIAKEALSGLSMGIILGSIVGPLAHYGMGISQHVATVIWCTLPLVSTIAATLGSTIPFACLALGLNPSVIAAPAMTSLVDVSGLLSYFMIASKIFRAFGIKLK